MGTQPAFHLFRFPIHIRPGFIVFMVLVIAVNGGELGVWIAGSAALLTLLHELGHAFAARATGAQAEISLDFLAGYASFVPVRRLTSWERAGISIAGPAVQIGVGVAALMAMGVNPLDSASYTSSPAALAIWWTGPMMGLFNLVPVLPLDGGHIVLAGLDAIAPKHSTRVMLWFSIALTSAGGIYLLSNTRSQGLAYFVLFPLMVQLQMLFADSPKAAAWSAARSARSVAAHGEAEAWTSGDVSQIPAGLVPSPWFRASQQLRQGHPDVARHVLLTDFAETGPPNWWPPDMAAPAQLTPLVALLPRPFPSGRPHSEHALATILLRIGQHDDAARYAAASFGRVRSTTTAAIVARAAAALGDRDTALGWLNAAVQVDPDGNALAVTMDAAPEFAELRHDPRFVSARARLDP
jgi:Zn-dependent protease